ncbi:type VI secretion system lipoprotein TssJ [uncultured Thiodictyon sp.]|uniref:type VI secretion system lipoprotein TssJ n=1 Tax=uncultured Thiodictyon sp. TaxID=1846217 RepID=UPI0025D59FA3|nr:type VI secretion system lipoprotein TssJ [uncultured Thiodictyon sp.]
MNGSGPGPRAHRAPMAAAMLAALVGCAGKPPPAPPSPAADQPPQLRITVSAAADANRDQTGRGLPIVVRLYELKAAGDFAGADFFRLYEQEAAALGATLIAREEVTLAPGQRRLTVLPLSPAATHLGVLGAFNDIDRAGWRALQALEPGRDNSVEVEVGAAAINVRRQ